MTVFIESFSYIIDEDVITSYGEHFAPVPSAQKRRLTTLGQNVLCHLNGNMANDTPIVAASRNGDVERMFRLFHLIEKQQPLSPTDFSLSVHNAIAANYSIITKNKHPHTAISGGKNTFIAGLLDAYLYVKSENKPVVFVYYDIPLPSIYDNIVDEIEFSTIALFVFKLTPTLSSVSKQNFFEISYKNESDNKKDNEFSIRKLKTFLCSSTPDLLENGEKIMYFECYGSYFEFKMASR